MPNISRQLDSDRQIRAVMRAAAVARLLAAADVAFELSPEDQRQFVRRSPNAERVDVHSGGLGHGSRRGGFSEGRNVTCDIFRPNDELPGMIAPEGLTTRCCKVQTPPGRGPRVHWEEELNLPVVGHFDGFPLDFTKHERGSGLNRCVASQRECKSSDHRSVHRIPF